MIGKLFKKILGDRNKRQMKTLQPLVDEINAKYENLHKLSDDELKNKVKNIQTEIQNTIDPIYEELNKLTKKYRSEQNENKKEKIHNEINELDKNRKETTQQVLDNNLAETFAIIKDTCRRLKERQHTYEVRGEEKVWDMVPFDVQLMGGIVLHQGMISEMATGEGKTLVATLPLFLNALTKKGAHLVTVNDYLATRDCEWMSPVFHFHGLTVGVIYSQMDQEERQNAYRCDVTYGTNSEFGFDYLRDNGAVHISQLAQRQHSFAIVDEVDSVLIDEARTPLIISGPVKESKNFYQELKPFIKDLFVTQTHLVQRFNREFVQEIGKDDVDWEKAGKLLLLIQRGAPKSKIFRKHMQDADLNKMISDLASAYRRDKKMHEIDEQLFYVVDEHAHSCDLTEQGQERYSNPDIFNFRQLDELLLEVDENDGLSFDEKQNQKAEVTSEFMDRSEKLHNIAQLLKSYALFEKEIDYIVQNDQVIIVDEFTGRPMPGRRFSDGLHQALECKENVKVQEATQTLATITLQNYFKLYDKLAGMTGTALTEEGEFMEIYKLKVVPIPTNKPITRKDHDDLIYLTKNDKYRAIIEEVKYWHEKQKPVLVGTVSVEVSETLSRLLSRAKIKHHVLNAKKPEMESKIIQNAGSPGAVTIATNMAGRGTDIKLGNTVINHDLDYYVKAITKINEEQPYGGHIDGLHVIGTERHESRRIDRQLRGRAGRQGDPGTSRFYLSLEDDLMRLFGSDRIAPMMVRLGLGGEEAISHPWMSNAVEKAQKRVELRNFEIRKNLLQYDEVMNQQRNVIYNYRKRVLEGDDLKYEIQDMIKDHIANIVELTAEDDKYEENWKLDRLISWFATLGIKVTEETFNRDRMSKETLEEDAFKIIEKVYTILEESFGADTIRQWERSVLLMVVDEQWREHLHEMDLLKEGIGLRAYGSKDPLLEFKKEGFILFSKLIEKINEEICKYVLKPGAEALMQESVLAEAQTAHAETSAYGAPEEEPAEEFNEPVKQQPVVTGKKIGRNDPCPCGSGKKFKKCCGKNTFEE